MATDDPIDALGPVADAGIDEEALRRFAARADEGPVRMLDLLRFRAEGGRERYQEYLRQVGAMVERVGGRVLTAGIPAELLIGDPAWDLVLIVEYPTRQAFLDLVGSPEYGRIEHLRHGALERSVLYALDPVEAQR